LGGALFLEHSAPIHSASKPLSWQNAFNLTHNDFDVGEADLYAKRSLFVKSLSAF